MTPVVNASAASQWIRDRLMPVHYDGAIGVRVGSIVPTGFDAYCRIFHPAYRRVQVAGKIEHAPVRWKQVAEDNGTVFHSLAQWHTILGHPELHRFHHPEWGTAPNVGWLDDKEARLLVSLLSQNTGTPDTCYFAWWDGGFHGDRRGLMAVELGAYQYFVYQGELDETHPLNSPNLWWPDPPNLWWPEDLAWCVATDIDSFSTLLGGGLDCIAAVLSGDQFEALPVNVNDRIDLFGGAVNT